jgi:cytoskeletal protein CcmA (bactofilin family)
MGFFKDFKDDFSQAVNELVPGEDNLEATATEDDLVVNTLEDEVDVASELSKLDGLLEQVTKKDSTQSTVPATEETAAEPVQEAQTVPQNNNHTTQEEKKMADNTIAAQSTAQNVPTTQQEKIVSDEVSVITEGTVIKGDIVSNGSLDVKGQVNGNVSCNGKLTVTGVVNGNSNTSEFFADAAQVEGEVVSSGTVKIGLGSVIIGNLTSTSAVIAGAIKGDIDVQGPVVVDTSAVVMGNIKSRSVQINNGAVIEGFCSQCYSDVDVQSLFESKKGSMN